MRVDVMSGAVESVRRSARGGDVAPKWGILARVQVKPAREAGGAYFNGEQHTPTVRKEPHFRH